MPKMRSKDDYETSGGEIYGLLEDGEYIVKVAEIKRVNRISKYNPEAKETLDIYVTPIAFADAPEDELTDVDGKPVHPDKHLVFFGDENKMGTFPQYAKTRRFVAAAFQTPLDDELNFEWDDVIGKELVLEVTTSDAGQNRTGNPRPVKKARSRRSNASAPLVEAAAGVFDTDTAPTDDLLF